MKKKSFLLVALLCCWAGNVQAAEPGTSCNSAIPLGYEFSQIITQSQKVWYSAWLFNLPLEVSFVPENVSDPAPELDMDFGCTSGVYDDPLLCSLFCPTNATYISLPYRPTWQTTTIDEKTVYSVSLGKNYRNLLISAGLSYNVEVLVSITFHGTGSLKIVSDSFSACMADAKFMQLGDTVMVRAYDKKRHVIVPYVQWQDDSIRYVWNSEKECQLAVASTCDFDPQYPIDERIIQYHIMQPGDTIYVPKGVLAEYANSPEYSSEAGMYFAKFYSVGEGVMKIERVTADPDPEEPAPCLLASGTCGAEGDNLTWELSCEGVLTISGTGEMANYHTFNNRSPWDGKTNIKQVIFGDEVTTVGDYAFYNCRSIKAVSLSNSITYIGTVAFEYCDNLTEIEIPNSVTTINTYALAGCGFTTVFIPSSVTSIGRAALEGGNLQLINVAEDNPAYCSVDGVLFDKNKTVLIKYPGGKQGECLIPATVTSIAYSGMASGITSITSEALVPPSLDKGALDLVDKSIPLYVHYQSLEAYKSAGQWKKFTNILPIEESFPVIFLDHDSKVLSEQFVNYNMAAEAPQVPEREGYTFSGWSVDIKHIVAPTYAIALYDKIGGTVTYLSEEGDVIATENVDLHLPEAPAIEGKSFKGWLTESADAENGIVLRATYSSDNPTTNEDVTITPSSNSAAVVFPFITGALTYQLVIRNLHGKVVCKILFSATGHLLGIAFAPSRNQSQQATQATGFNFTVEGLDANTTYEYEFVANDDTDEVIETLAGSFTTMPKIATDIDSRQAPAKNSKYLKDGHLFIDNNDRTFDARGQQVK